MEQLGVFTPSNVRHVSGIHFTSKQAFVKLSTFTFVSLRDD